jgi:hypothetical protein
MRINDSIRFGLFLAMGIPLVACLCNGISLNACLLLCIPSLAGLLLLLFTPRLWQAGRKVMAALPQPEPVQAPIIDRKKALRMYKEVESMGGLIVFMNRAALVSISTQNEDKFKQSISLMISYIDDMKEGIDDLSKVFEEMI